ncbi:ruBisCO large subunit-binding protein subunit beta, chloroplastic-like [Gossypium raimondii]|uniref:ruBisCO large subunit-binding protein subunit beta, chloroplastic-like n=1 Tax=Gossypium raimondii TaxID=29730 RepID=UPI00227B19D8|nr:ruBisCO large subunit-binding protein subunit beta, chloroplastic-like [Gossypium raimondii]
MIREIPYKTACFWAIYQAAVEEGIVGGGCTSLRLASKVDAIKDSLDNDEEKVVRCCLEHATSVAKTVLMSDCVVVEIKCLLGTPWMISNGTLFCSLYFAC